MPYRSLPRSQQALTVLRGGGLVLMPTANLWQVATTTGGTDGLRRLLTLCPPAPQNRPELLFADRLALKAWFPHVHPRLDTLTVLFGRPLTMLLPATPRVPLALTDAQGEVAVRIAMDSVVQQLCEDLEQPLAACLALGPGAEVLPTGFGQIRSDVLRGTDHLVRRRVRDHLGNDPAVTVRVDDKGKLVFL